MIRKELRALAPAWLAIVAALLAVENTIALFRHFGPAAYFIGGVALGAQVFGREYADRTLPMLLAQPVRRERILLVKLGVLAALLVALAVVAAFTFRFLPQEPSFTAMFLLFPVLTGLCVAPWLTMISRSAIAGTVFPLGIAGMVLLASEWLSVTVHGYTREADTLRMAINWWAMAGFCAAGAVLTWRAFVRLEAIDGSGTVVGADRPRSAATEKRTLRHPVWLLASKELRLQQLSFAVAGIYVAAYLVAYVTSRDGSRFDDGVTVLTVLYGGLLALLIGSLASAEERQLGTLEWQALLPMATWRQWAMKAGTAIGLAVVLGVVLPALLVAILPPPDGNWPNTLRIFLRPSTTTLVVVLATVGLYLSTLCRNAMWALVISMPVVMAGAIFIQSLAYPIERAVYRAFEWAPVRSAPRYLTEDRAFGVLVAGLVALGIYLALQNHRSAERGARRAVPQVAVLLTCAIGGYALAMLVHALQ